MDATYTCQECRQIIEPIFVEHLSTRSTLWTVPNRCDSCREREREPQGETVRLFDPAPTVMRGQMDLNGSH